MAQSAQGVGGLKYDAAKRARLAELYNEVGSAYLAMANAVSPYGDGHSAERIVARIARFLERVDHAAGVFSAAYNDRTTVKLAGAVLFLQYDGQSIAP